MSKNLTRKGLALGTALSFALTGLSALPASADNAGLVTLMPSAGTTFNALIGATQGITLKATVDADINSTNAAKLSYLVTNTARTTLTFDAVNLNEDVYSMAGGAKSTVDADDALNAASILVSTSGNGTESLKITSTKAASFTVQSFVDKDEDGILDATEQASKAETVNLYDAADVTVSAIVDAALANTAGTINVKLAFGKGVNVDQVDKTFYGVAIYKNGVNQAVASPAVNNTYVAGVTQATTDYALSADLERLGSTATDSVGRLIESVDQTAAVVAGANYSARVAYLASSAGVYYDGTHKDLDLTKVVWAGSRSASVYIPEGSDTTVDALRVSVSDTKNTKGDAATTTAIKVRTGVKAVKFTAQARKAGDTKDYASSNVRIKAVLTATTLGTGSKLSIDGSTEVAAKVNETVTVFGRTDADGKFSVTVTDSEAATADAYSVAFTFLDDDNSVFDGTGETATATYEAATVTTFKAVSHILAGSTVNAEFKVLDQYGQGISSNTDGALSVYLADGDTTKLKKTAAVSNGKATISFANYLTKGDSSALTAKLFYGSTYASDVVVTAATTEADVTLYNPEATGAVIVDATKTGDITYSPFVTGDPVNDGNDDTAAPEILDVIAYVGRVEDVNGAGLPGAVVTVKGTGLQFEDKTSGTASGEFYKDSITVVADASGEFTLNVWAHKTGDTKITVTSGGKSASTVLTARFNTSTTADRGLNGTNSGTDLIKITWNVQKHPAVNGVYILTAVVSDKWGNALKGASVNFEADGALLVNSDNSKTRTTNSAGKATVYLGTVKDAKGFGSVSATVATVQVDRDTTVAGIDVASVALGSEENLTVSADVVVGPDATAAASKTAGLVKATVYNASGKTVQVYVAGKLVATKKASGSSYSFNVKAAKGDKKVTVKVAGSTFFSDVITVK